MWFFKVSNQLSKFIFFCGQHETHCQVAISGVLFSLIYLFFVCLISLKIFSFQWGINQSWIYWHWPSNMDDNIHGFWNLSMYSWQDMFWYCTIVWKLFDASNNACVRSFCDRKLRAWFLISLRSDNYSVLEFIYLYCGSALIISLIN